MPWRHKAWRRVFTGVDAVASQGLAPWHHKALCRVVTRVVIQSSQGLEPERHRGCDAGVTRGLTRGAGGCVLLSAEAGAQGRADLPGNDGRKGLLSLVPAETPLARRGGPAFGLCLGLVAGDAPRAARRPVRDVSHFV